MVVIFSSPFCVDFAASSSKDYCNVFLIPQLTLEFPMKYSIFKAFLYLPSCLTFLKTIHGISALQLELEHSLNVKMNYLQLVEAFTSKDVTQFFNYDLLEIYGDAVVKFPFATSLISRYFVCSKLVLLNDADHPSEYEKRKWFLISNRRLANRGLELGFDRIIRSKCLPTFWGNCNKLRWAFRREVMR